MDEDTTTMLPDPVPAELRRRIKASGSQAAAAKELAISPSLITEILKGRRTASPTLLEKLGFVKVTIHVKAQAVSSVVRAIGDVIQDDTDPSPSEKKRRAPVAREIALVA